MLANSIIKVSASPNHMVDSELMEMCGKKLAERLRDTMPSKLLSTLLSLESTGLIAGLPMARKLGIPLVFNRENRPITISDSYQTTIRSATMGMKSGLIVSCEHLEAGTEFLSLTISSQGFHGRGTFKACQYDSCKSGWGWASHPKHVKWNMRVSVRVQRARRVVGYITV